VIAGDVAAVFPKIFSRRAAIAMCGKIFHHDHLNDSGDRIYAGRGKARLINKFQEFTAFQIIYCLCD